MFSPMTGNQRKSAYLAFAAFAIAMVSSRIEVIPVMIAIAAFLVGTAFFMKAMFPR